MYKEIIDIIVEEMSNREGLDELKSAIAFRLSVIKVADKDWDYLITEIVYRLAR